MSASSLTGDRVSFNNVVNTVGDGYYTIGTLDANLSPLPIELMRFDVNVCDKDVCVDWITATESLSDFFIVEKTTNGIDFEITGKLAAAGNSRALLNYKLIDKNPYDGVSYYRLCQIDLNGSKVYYKLKEVKFNSGKDFFFFCFSKP